MAPGSRVHHRITAVVSSTLKSPQSTRELTCSCNRKGCGLTGTKRVKLLGQKHSKLGRECKNMCNQK